MTLEMPKNFNHIDVLAGAPNELSARENALAREKLFQMLETGGISQKGENITPLDGFSTEKMNEDEITELILKALKLKNKDELEANLSKMSLCLREAKNFYKNFLLSPFDDKSPKLPKELEKIEEFKDSSDLLNFIAKSSAFRKGGRQGFGPLYCGLLKIMLVEWDCYQKDFQGLIKETEFLNNETLKVGKDGIQHFHPTRHNREEWLGLGVYTGSKWINTFFTYRGKSQDSIILKGVKSPEVTIDEIIKDGIGLKFEVKTPEEAGELLLFLSQYLQENFEAKDLIFENVNFLPKEKSKNLENSLSDLGIASKSEKNFSSNPNFQTAKIRGKIKLPKNGDPGQIRLYRNFEIQIVPADNQNDTGYAQSAIYKRAQKLNAYTRLFGGFSEKYLDAICIEASKATEEIGAKGEILKIAPSKIKRYFITNFLVKIKNGNYASREHIDRWDKSGILPEGVITPRKEKAAKK